ncbi:single-stranded-DNA-specific exonuclease RecJ [Parashewanella spongiae]|uniref:Single-stranded-DNA-specific exonuclease RecJ n=1 Tax=Parashewanella spongiae TaxID=342950 RepID=A0A3A6U0T1_9GAMM|nr:single-stranded-DNA-specific exonuclease RecJ [Parashewanella spongiae]MCL1076945.1 single-stranded-DNA-specific exonuclease RecJ [Parashewanella spongiae]RJY18939.1 single-stranded-DNA-specific exonuclease RecJ [Parashewanella spongiae]
MHYNVIRRPNVDDSHLPATLPFLLKQLYARRGVTVRDCNSSLASLLRPDTMKGQQQAATLICDAIESNKAIIIVGDFDADGATSTSICLLALKMMGAKRVSYLIPNRFDYGYGLSPEIVEIAAQQGAELLITVDNGISSITGVAAANQLDIPVVVTDHHLAGDTLPEAAAIVNPNQPDCPFASKAIAGVGVAFYLMSSIRAELKRRNWFESQHIIEPNLAILLDIVALGTVADVVPLDSNNRIIVEAGLRRVRSGRCRVGITALLEIAKRNPQRVVASDFGFAVGPRLNAAGRLDEMSLGVELLLCEDINKARTMAAELDGLNQERREIEAGMQHEALAKLKQLNINDDNLPQGLVVYQQDWHQGVIGILASRIKDKYHRPVIAFAQAENGEIKGSARSIKGVHMRDLLEKINTLSPDLIIKFGGHAMAAGLSIKAEAISKFEQLYHQVIAETVTPELLTGELFSDGELAANQLEIETAEMIRYAGPWGQEFEEPCFDGRFTIIQQRLVGEKHLKLVLETECGSKLIDAIAFNIDLKAWPNLQAKKVDVVYSLEINEFRGNQSLQLMVKQISAV